MFNYEVQDVNNVEEKPRKEAVKQMREATGDNLNEKWASIYKQMTREKLFVGDTQQQEVEETQLVEECGIFFDEHNLKRLEVPGAKYKRLSKQKYKELVKFQ